MINTRFPPSVPAGGCRGSGGITRTTTTPPSLPHVCLGAVCFGLSRPLTFVSSACSRSLRGQLSLGSSFHAINHTTTTIVWAGLCRLMNPKPQKPTGRWVDEWVRVRGEVSWGRRRGWWWRFVRGWIMGRGGNPGDLSTLDCACCTARLARSQT